jgi:hypothetical protein
MKILILEKDYQKLIRRNQIEENLLLNKFKHKRNSYNTFIKKVGLDNFSINVWSSSIEVFKNKKQVKSFEFDQYPIDFFLNIEFLNHIYFNNETDN